VATKYRVIATTITRSDHRIASGKKSPDSWKRNLSYLVSQALRAFGDFYYVHFQLGFDG
jgi:hypothetical protein